MLIVGSNPAACPNHKSTICAVPEAAAPGPIHVSPLVLRMAAVEAIAVGGVSVSKQARA